jgi:hypothetical protein
MTIRPVVEIRIYLINKLAKTEENIYKSFSLYHFSLFPKQEEDLDGNRQQQMMSPDQGSNPQSTAFKVSTLTIAPLMRLLYIIYGKQMRHVVQRNCLQMFVYEIFIYLIKLMLFRGNNVCQLHLQIFLTVSFFSFS